MGSGIGRFGVWTQPAGRRAVLAAGLAAGVTGIAGANRVPARVGAQAETLDELGLLTFLLSLDQMEASLMDEGLDRFTDADWEQVLGIGSARLDLETIRDQEQAHVAALTTVIADAGGTPPEPVRYDFGYDDAPGFVRVASGIAQTVAAGYAGVVPLLMGSPALVTVVGILSVEGRHAAYLKLRNGESPFPDPIDQPLTRDEVLANLIGYTGGQTSSVPTEAPAPPPTPFPAPAPTATAAPAVDADRNVFAAVIADAAAVLGVDQAAVDLADVEEVEWPDASLGCPESGMMYAQVITPGYRVIVRAAGETLEYHTDMENAFVRCA